MKSEDLAYGLEILAILDEKTKMNREDLEKESTIKGKDLDELLDYLKSKGYIQKPLALWGMSGNSISDKDRVITILHKGREVISGMTEYGESDTYKKTINQNTYINHSPGSQVANAIGSKQNIVQKIDNSKINVLRQIINDDDELVPENKSKLLEILEKFNILKTSGENAYNLIKTVGKIGLKYVPLFLSLLK